MLVFASPVVGIDATSAYNDLALACVAFTLFCLLQLWDAERTQRLLVLIGLVAGLGYAVKYTAFVGVLYAALFVAWKQWRGPMAGAGNSESTSHGATPLWALRQAGIVLACAAVMIVPWMLKNWLWVQNPLSPFFNNLFPNPYVTTTFEREFREYLAIYDLPTRWMIPWAATTSGRLAGVLGPIFLLAPVALFSLRRREGRQLLLAAAVFGAPYFSNIGARFLIVPLPFVALAMMLALGTSAFGSTAAVALALFHAAISWPAMVPKYALPGVWALETIPFREALRLKLPEGYLQAHLVWAFGVDQMIEQATAPGSTIFTYQVVPEAYTSRRILVDYQAAENHHDGSNVMDRFLARLDFRPRCVRDLPLTNNRFAQSEWCRPNRRQQRMAHPRVASLRRRSANPAKNGVMQVTAGIRFPWGIDSAFDNNPVTFWECGVNLKPGMYVEADFNGVRQADLQLIETSPNQADLHLRLLATRN